MIESYPKYSIEIKDFEPFILPNTEEPFLLTINKENVKFDFLIRRNLNNPKAIVFGSGAYNAQSERKPPIFQRHKWMEEFNETLIYYNDPTLYLGEINIGWGFGFEDRHYLPEVAELIVSLLKKCDILLEKTLLYGSSAGGFMSLMLGGYLKKAKVLVNNPQTIVWNYYDRHVNSMFSSAHPTLTREEIINRYPERLEVIHLYNLLNNVPSITYLQNVSSKRDITHHLNPFIEGLEKLDENNFQSELEIHLYSDKERGHEPLRKSDTLKNIKRELNKI